jgi:hypothetical protein
MAWNTHRKADVQVRVGTADIAIPFDQGKQLQVLPFSSCYERGKSMTRMETTSSLKATVSSSL